MPIIALSEPIVNEDVITPSKDERAITDVMLKTDAKKDESMDDRLSISSDDSLTTTKLPAGSVHNSPEKKSMLSISNDVIFNCGITFDCSVSSKVGEVKKVESEVEQEVIDVVVKKESKIEESMDDRLSMSSDGSLSANRPTGTFPVFDYHIVIRENKAFINCFKSLLVICTHMKFKKNVFVHRIL